MAAVVALLSEDNEDGADCKATLDVVVVDIRHDGTDCRSVLVVVARTADEGEGDRKVRTSAEGEAAPRDAAVCSCLWWQSPRWAAAALLGCCSATGHSKMVVVVEMERVIAAAGDGVMEFAADRANVVVVHLPENEVVVVVGMAVDDRTAACEGEVGSVLDEVVAGGACGAVVVLRCSRAAAAELRLDANKADSLLLLRSPELRLDREDGDILVVVVVGSSAVAGVQLKAFRPDKAQVALVLAAVVAASRKTW